MIDDAGQQIGVWAQVVGQPDAVEVLASAAAAGAAWSRHGRRRLRRMTHAWLFTGPPGSGRSVAARAFAAALQCRGRRRLWRVRRLPHHDGRHTR